MSSHPDPDIATQTSNSVEAVRISALERRSEVHDSSLHDHSTRLAEMDRTQAVHGTEFRGLARDVSLLVDEIKSTNQKIDSRLSKLTLAAWGLFLVLLPIAFTLVAKMLEHGG
jgi:hypothetical protein